MVFAHESNHRPISNAPAAPCLSQHGLTSSLPLPLSFSFILPRHLFSILVFLYLPSPPNPFPTSAVQFQSSPRGDARRPQWSEGSREHPPPGSPRTGAQVTAWVRIELSVLHATLSMVTSDPREQRRRRLRGTDLFTRAPPCWLRLDQSSAAARPEQWRPERVDWKGRTR